MLRPRALAHVLDEVKADWFERTSEIEHSLISPSGAISQHADAQPPLSASRCVIVTTDAEFDGLRPLWDELLTHCAHSSVFCSWTWARTWWEHFQTHLTRESIRLQLHLICLYDRTDQLIGLAPMYCALPDHAPTRLASLRPLGSRIIGTQEDMTEEPVLLLRLGREGDALNALVHALSVGEDVRSYDYFVLRRYENPSNPALTAQYEALRQQYVSLKREVQPGQTVVLAKSWNEFRGSLSKSMRDNLKYYPRLLTRHGHDWQIETQADPAAVREATRLLVALHRRRAESTRGIAHTNHLPNEFQAEFLIDVLQRLAEQGKASVLTLRVDGEIVAALAVLHHELSITMYYSGFDPVWYDYSPITILTAEALRQGITDGIATANFLPGAFPWKDRWGAISDRAMVQYTLMRRHPRSLLRAALNIGRRALTITEPT